MIKPIKKVKETRKLFKIDNFYKFCLNMLNLTLTKDGEIDLTFGLKKQGKKFPTDDNVVFTKEIDGTFYAMTLNGFVLKCSSSGYEVLGESAVMTMDMVEIWQNGNKKILVTSDTPFIVGEGSVDFPLANAICSFNNRLVFGVDNTVCITKPFDFDSVTTSLEVCENIVFDSDDGLVLGFYVKDNAIFTFCEKSIKKITMDENFDNFTVETISEFGVGDNGLSIAGSLDYCVFYKDNLIIFDGKKFKSIQTIIDDEAYYVLNRGKICEDKYYLSVCKGGNDQYMFVHDIKTGAQTLIKMDNGQAAAGNYITQNGVLYKLAENSVLIKQSELTLRPLHFGVSKEKTLYSVSFHSESAGALYINGPFGQKTYTVKKGHNHIKTNLSAREFNVKFTFVAKAKLNNLTFEYVIKGV